MVFVPILSLFILYNPYNYYTNFYLLVPCHFLLLKILLRGYKGLGNPRGNHNSQRGEGGVGFLV